MAELDIYKLVYLLFVTSATTGFAHSLKSPYIERTLSDAKLCHPLGKKGDTFVFSSDENASVIVRSTDAWSKWNSPCKFVFKVHKGKSLIAVIQNMYLRKEGTHCVDYVRFKRKDGIKTKDLCGSFDRRSGTFSTYLDELPDFESDEKRYDIFGEYDSDGEIETMIYLDSRKTEPNEKLELTIVYTPYKDCRKIKSHREQYQEVPVSGSVSGNVSICMWKEFICDGYQNCIPPLCQDEEGCPLSVDVVSNGTGTKVTIGAVTTMLLCFIIFLMGLWICKRHKKLCWSSDCAGPTSHDNRLPRAEREADDTANPSVAVSPMLEVAVLPSVLDKDLPPSYDSLFPEQSNPSTT